MEFPEHTALDLVACPECGAPAEVVDRFVLESTDGPIEHVIVLCALRHRFTVLTERLNSGRLPAPTRKEQGPWAPKRHLS